MATVTIIDGPAQIIQGTQRFNAIAGMPLAADAIIETSEKTFVQLEAAAGPRVDLGPKTRLLTASSGGKRAAFLKGAYLLNGWLKVSTAATDDANSGTATIATPAFDIVVTNGVVVAYANGTQATVFVESGSARLVEAKDIKDAKDIKGGTMLTGNQSFQQRRGTPGVRGVGTALLDTNFPIQFRDTLPGMLAKYDGVKVTLPPGNDIAYADVRDWLVLEDAAVRRQFLRWWRAKANEEAFRAGLIADLRLHTEWHDILFPPPPPEPAAKNSTAAPADRGAASPSISR